MTINYLLPGAHGQRQIYPHPLSLASDPVSDHTNAASVPAVASRDTNVVPKIFSRQKSSASSELSEKRVLVVDDQRCVLQATVPLLEEWGMTVVATTNSKEALRHLMTEEFDLFMTDLVMPSPNGVELLNAMIAHGKFIPTLVLSGSQGDRQTSSLFGDLSDDPFETHGFPIAFMKKEIGDLAGGLQRRLLRLSRRPVYVRETVESLIPQFSDLIAVELRADRDGGGISSDKFRLMAEAVNDFLDTRFSLYVRSQPLIEKIRSYVNKLSDETLKVKLVELLEPLSQFSPYTRDRMLAFNLHEWHNFKSEGLYFYFDALALKRKLMEGEAPEDILELVNQLCQWGQDFSLIAYNTAQLRNAGEVPETKPLDLIREYILKH